MTTLAKVRQTTSFRWVGGVFLLLLAIGLGAAVIVYRRYVAYEPSAASHVPDDAPFAVRFDLTHVMLYEPFRRSIFPLVDRIPEAEPGASRRERLARAGLDVGGSVRELVVTIGPQPGDWTAAVGGTLPRHDMDRVVAKVLREEGRSVDETSGGFTVAVGPAPIAFRQAENGALVFASSPARLERALSRRAPVAELSQGAGGLIMSGLWLRPPLARLSGTFRAGSVLAVELDARLAAPVNIEMAEAAVRALLDRLGSVDDAFAHAVRSSRVTVGPDRVTVGLGLPREGAERLAELAARALTGTR